MTADEVTEHRIFVSEDKEVLANDSDKVFVTDNSILIASTVRD